MRNPLSLEAFADWLEKQPGEKKYKYISATQCLICQYFNAIGLDFIALDSRAWCDHNYEDHKLPDHFNDIAHGVGDDLWTRHTFGSAARRARELLKEKV